MEADAIAGLHPRLAQPLGRLLDGLVEPAVGDRRVGLGSENRRMKRLVSGRLLEEVVKFRTHAHSS
jgi:hypothetical protein